MVSAKGWPIPGATVGDYSRFDCGFYDLVVERLDAGVAALEFQFELFLFLGHLFGLIA